MILSALVLAATVATPPLKEAPMPNLYRPPARCGELHGQVARHIQAATGRRPAAQYAVLRKVDGCMVPAPARYRQDYLLPGQADAPQYRPAPDADPKR